MDVCTNKIKNKIEDLNKDLKNCDYCHETATKAYEKMIKFAKKDSFDNVSEEERKEFQLNSQLAYPISIKHNIEALEKTLKSNLMKIEKKFVAIPNTESLISPTGFVPADRVFLQTKVAIQSNNAMQIEDLPYMSCGYKVYNMEEI